MDSAVIVAIGGGLTGLGGLAAVLKVFTDARLERKKHDQSTTNLATTLNKSAQEWVEYVDKKFDKVQGELTSVSNDFSEFKTKAQARDMARMLLQQAHQAWDYTVKGKLEELTGQRIEDPPPLDIPPSNH